MSRAVVVLVLLTASVRAQPSTESTTLFEEGRALAKQQKWAEACDKFQRSLALDAAPGTKLNLGECLEKQGKIRDGWLMFEAAARDFGRADDPRAKFAQERAAAASMKLATLVIKVADPDRDGLTIRIGDRTVPAQAEIVERVDPGPTVVTGEAPDAKTHSTEVVAFAGKRTVVDVPMLVSQQVADEQPGEAAGDPPNGPRTRVVIAIGVASVGGAALVGSGILVLLAKSQYEGADCENNICSVDGQRDVESALVKADIATGFAIAGAALAATGVILYLTAPKRAVAVAPIASSSSVSVVLAGRF